MGLIPLSYKNKHDISFLENKKITILKPTYLVFYKNKYQNGYNYKNVRSILSLEAPHKGFEYEYEFIIKINCNITFYIKDIIGYCDNEGGFYKYEVTPILLNKIKLKDITIIHVCDIFKILFDEKHYEYLELKMFMYDNFFPIRCYSDNCNYTRCAYPKYYDNTMKNEDKLKKFIHLNKDTFLIENL